MLEDSPNTGFAGSVDAEASAPSGSSTGWSMHTGFAGNADATACAASGANKSMTEPEEHGADWQMLTAFASDAADATACTASGADKSIMEPKEHAGWQMHTDFAGNSEVGTETTTALRFGWGV